MAASDANTTPPDNVTVAVGEIGATDDTEVMEASTRESNSVVCEIAAEK